MKKLQKIFSHPCGILCDLSIEKWDNIRNMRERYVVSAPGNSLYVSCVFRCSPQQNSTYVLQLAEYILILFFRRHGSTRVRMYLVILQSNILVHTFFQVEVTTVNICSFFRIEIWREQKNTSVFKFGFHRSKRWDTSVFKPFDFVFTNWDRLPDYMRPGLEPIKGAHVCWGLPWISTLKLEILCLIYYYILTYIWIHLWIFRPAQWKNNMLFKVLRVQLSGYIPKKSADNLKRIPKLVGVLFDYPWLVFSSKS